jgi:four helix bundle protein
MWLARRYLWGQPRKAALGWLVRLLADWQVALIFAFKNLAEMPQDIHERTLRFAVRIAKLVDALPRQVSGRVIADQIMRSAASVGAHCREARRARTKAEFASKLNVALQEADETSYWLDLIAEIRLLEPLRLVALQREASELQAMLSAAISTSKRTKVVSPTATR